MKEFFAGMAFTLILEGVAAVVIAAEKIKEAIEDEEYRESVRQRSRRYHRHHRHFQKTQITAIGGV